MSLQNPQYPGPFIPSTDLAPIASSEQPQATREGNERNDKKRRQFDFPDGGWECSKCQNYNFKGRKECHRCKKAKADDDHDGKPTHMFLPAEEKAALKAAKSKKSKNKSKKESNNSYEGHIVPQEGST